MASFSPSWNCYTSLGSRYNLLSSVIDYAYQECRTWDIYRQDPGIQDPKSGTQDPRTHKVKHGNRNPKIFKLNQGLPIFYNFNRLFYTYYFTLHLLQNFALIIIQNFSEILGKKNCEGVPIYLVKLKILSLQLHKCIPFWLFLRCFLNVSEYLFWWFLCKHIHSEFCWSMGFF